MPTIRNSLTENSTKDNTGDKINGSEVDANPNLIANILDGTTQTDLAQSGTVYYRALAARTVAASAASVTDVAFLEWDPASGTPVDGMGVGIRVTLPDDSTPNDQIEVASIDFVATDVSDATMDCRIDIRIIRAGTLATIRKIPDRWGLGGWDYIVEGTDGDFTTLQGADDDAGAAAYTMFVKQGTYAAGITVASNNAKIYLEPGTVIQAAITLSGNNVTLILGNGCDVQGLITLSGTGCALICEGGVDIDGITMSGTACLVDGGGWDTLSNGGTARNGLLISGNYNIAKNISLQTTAGGGSAFDAVSITGANNRLDNYRVPASDGDAVDIGGGSENDVGPGLVEGADVVGIDISASPRSRVHDNHVAEVSGTQGIVGRDNSDNFMIVNNHVEEVTTAIDIGPNCDNGLIDGNVINSAISDGGTGNTVGDNEVY